MLIVKIFVENIQSKISLFVVVVVIVVSCFLLLLLTFKRTHRVRWFIQTIVASACLPCPYRCSCELTITFAGMRAHLHVLVYSDEHLTNVKTCVAEACFFCYLNTVRSDGRTPFFKFGITFLPVSDK